MHKLVRLISECIEGERSHTYMHTYRYVSLTTFLVRVVRRRCCTPHSASVGRCGPTESLPPIYPPASKRERSVGEGRIRATWGWISVDRGSKATLPLTMPRRVFKSSAKDSARRPCEIDLQGGRPQLVRRGGLADGTGPSGPEPLLWVGRDGGRWRRLLAWILT